MCIIRVGVCVREGKGACHEGRVYVLHTVYVYLGGGVSEKDKGTPEGGCG